MAPLGANIVPCTTPRRLPSLQVQHASSRVGRRRLLDGPVCQFAGDSTCRGFQRCAGISLARSLSILRGRHRQTSHITRIAVLYNSTTTQTPPSSLHTVPCRVLSAVCCCGRHEVRNLSHDLAACTCTLAVLCAHKDSQSASLQQQTADGSIRPPSVCDASTSLFTRTTTLPYTVLVSLILHADMAPRQAVFKSQFDRKRTNSSSLHASMCATTDTSSLAIARLRANSVRLPDMHQLRSRVRMAVYRNHSSNIIGHCQS